LDAIYIALITASPLGGPGMTLDTPDWLEIIGMFKSREGFPKPAHVFDDGQAIYLITVSSGAVYIFSVEPD
jgi:hypothetical protein